MSTPTATMSVPTSVYGTGVLCGIHLRTSKRQYA
jgi:hypothetical protein